MGHSFSHSRETETEIAQECKSQISTIVCGLNPVSPLGIEPNSYHGPVFVCGDADVMGITEEQRQRRKYNFVPVDYSKKYFKNERIDKIVCGLTFTFFITSNCVYACGSNSDGELGLGYTSEGRILTPTPVPLHNFHSSSLTDIITGTCQYTVFVMQNGELLHCGYKLDRSYENNVIPKLLPTVPDSRYRKIVGGDSFLVILTLAGELYAIGHIDGYQLYLDKFKRLQFDLKLFDSGHTEQFIDVGCGQRHVIAITESGTAIGMGMQSYGQLGVPQSIMNGRESTAPIKINVCNKKVSRVFCKSFHTFFQSVEGKIYGSGFYADGRMGIDNTNATSSYYYEFIELEMPWIKSRIISVMGFISTIFITEYNDIYVAGGNANGHLGTGNSAPVKIAEKVKPDFPEGYQNLKLNCVYGHCHAMFYFTSLSLEADRFCCRLHQLLYGATYTDIIIKYV
jgi:alpha-tubulin suppressor-like RCC1 family protein